jgi:hypothetical protein
MVSRIQEYSGHRGQDYPHNGSIAQHYTKRSGGLKIWQDLYETEMQPKYKLSF